MQTRVFGQPGGFVSFWFSFCLFQRPFHFFVSGFSTWKCLDFEMNTFFMFSHHGKNYAHIWQNLGYMQMYWPRALRSAFRLSSGEEGYFRRKWRRGGLCTSAHFPVGLYRGAGFRWLGRKWRQPGRPRWGLRNTCAFKLYIEPFWLTSGV